MRSSTVREDSREPGEHKEEPEDMLPVRQARTIHHRPSEKVENKDNYKHKSKTNDKYRSRRDHKYKHKNKHID
jgi:hypothetical protein